MIVRQFMSRVKPSDRVGKSVRNMHTYRAARREEAKRLYREAKRRSK